MSDRAGSRAISAVTNGDVVEASWSRSWVVKGSTGTPYLVTLVLLPGEIATRGVCTCEAGRHDRPCWHVKAARLLTPALTHDDAA